MDISIKDSIINNIKDDKEEDIVKLINISVNDEEELVLPGLGVLLSLFWNDLSNDEKEKYVKIIKNKISNNT